MYKLDNSLKRRVKRMPKMLPMMKILLNQSKSKKLSRLSFQYQLQYQLFKLKLLQSKMVNKLGQVLTSLKPLRKLTNLYMLPSLLVTLKLPTLFQTTNHLHKKTLLKVDTLQSFSWLLLNKNLCMLSMKTSNISMLFIPTLKVSDCSLKTQVSVWAK